MNKSVVILLTGRERVLSQQEQAGKDSGNQQDFNFHILPLTLFIHHLQKGCNTKHQDFSLSHTKYCKNLFAFYQLKKKWKHF